LKEGPTRDFVEKILLLIQTPDDLYQFFAEDCFQTKIYNLDMKPKNSNDVLKDLQSCSGTALAVSSYFVSKFGDKDDAGKLKDVTNFETKVLKTTPDMLLDKTSIEDFKKAFLEKNNKDDQNVVSYLNTNSGSAHDFVIVKEGDLFSLFQANAEVGNQGEAAQPFTVSPNLNANEKDWNKIGLDEKNFSGLIDNLVNDPKTIFPGQGVDQYKVWFFKG